MKSPYVCPECDADWRLAMKQAFDADTHKQLAGRTALFLCINLCQTLTKDVFNKLTEVKQ